MCELKHGYTPAELWVECDTFFTKIVSELRPDELVVVLFITSQKFSEHVPREVADAKMSAYRSREHALEVMRDKRFLIMDGPDAFACTQLKVLELVEKCKATNPDFSGISTITQSMANCSMYSGFSPDRAQERDHRSMGAGSSAGGGGE